MTVEEGNKIIAEFEGMKFIPKAKWYNLFGYSCDVMKPSGYPFAFSMKQLKYDCDWSWLMPAWRKFVKIFIEFSHTGLFYSEFLRYKSEFHYAIDNDNITKCFEILADAIQWYNSQNPQQ